MLVVIDMAYAAIMVISALLDTRYRRFPRALWLSLGLCAAGRTGIAHGSIMLARNVAFGFTMCLILVAVELVWRRYRGVIGIGMGDIKYLFATCLFDPVVAALAFCCALVSLAAVGTMLRRASLPLLPFAVACFPVAIAFCAAI